MSSDICICYVQGMDTTTLTPKQAIFAKAKASGKTATEAALLAGSKNDISARKYATRVSRIVAVDQAIQKELRKQLRKHDITPKRILGIISDAMNATKVVVTGKDEDAFAEVQPDHSTRLRAATMASDLLGLRYKPSTPDQSPTNVPNSPNTEQIAAALESGDEVGQVRAIFS